MSALDDTIPFITLPNWVKAAARCGFNVEPVFRELGIATDLVHLESATVARPLMVKAMRACVQRSRGPHFPFMLGDTFAFEYLADLETFLTTSPTLRDASRVFDWVRELINPAMQVAFDETPRQTRLILSMAEAVASRAAREAERWFTEATFAAIVKFGRALLGEHGDFAGLHLAYPAPPYAAQYRGHFGLSVKFAQRDNALLIERRLMDLPLRGAFPALHEQAQYRVEQRLQRNSGRDDLATRIEKVLQKKTALLGLGFEAVAEELGLHPRTLQRRLGDSGQSFSDLLARVRYRLAMQWLDRADLELERVSEKLGFSDRRSFTRAFVGWSGMTPSRYRAKGGK